MIIKIARKLISPLSGKIKFQRFFEALNELSLMGMNIGGGSYPEDSGEKFVLEYIKTRFKPLNNLILFDVGANLGNYSALLQKVFDEKAKIYSFEPAHKTFQELSSNIGNKEGINLYNFGFGDKNGKTFLFSDPGYSALTSVYKRRLDHFNINLDQVEEVEIRTLDSFCKDNEIERIHFLKLDAEGHEKKILDGASELLKSGVIDFIQFEFGDCHIDSKTYFQDFYYLLNSDYKIYRVVKDGLYLISQYKLMYEAFAVTNYLAVSRRIA